MSCSSPDCLLSVQEPMHLNSSTVSEAALCTMTGQLVPITAPSAEI